MNLFLFTLAVVLYAVSCLPMFVAGRIEDIGPATHELKNVLLFADAICTILSYALLVMAFDSTMIGLAVSSIWFALMSCVGAVLGARGYDPYGLKYRKAQRGEGVSQ